MSKTLVLGASGFLGSHVTKALCEQGRDVRVLVPGCATRPRYTVSSIKCLSLLPNINASKARIELGWAPEPIEKSIGQAVDYYMNNAERV
jgi:nucleoside-diphosphate-sugar epimerase